MHPAIKQCMSLSLFLGLSCSGFFRFGTENLWADDDEKSSDIPTAEYQVKKGDTASKILFEMGIGTPESLNRLYGKTGWMGRLQAMNPKVTLSTLYPGQKIRIPVLDSSSIAAQKETPLNTTQVASEAEQCIPEKGAARFEKYTVQEGDSLSSLLYKRGIGHPDSKHRLFGRQGWMQRTQKFNSNITNWDHLLVGQQIVLLYPNQNNDETCPPKEEFAEQKEATKPSVEPIVATQESYDHDDDDTAEDKDFSLAAKTIKTQDEIVKKPEEASIEEIAALPQDMQELISVDAIASKLDIDTVADMDDEVAEKVPPQAVQKRATQVSIEEGSAPEMEKIFKNLKRTPVAYVGVYVRSAFGSRDTLATKLRSYGLLGEVREGMLEGLRLQYERAPKFGVKVGITPKEYLKYERGYLGWAFALPGPSGDMEMHLTPRFGALKLGSEVLVQDAAQQKVSQGLNSDQVNTGGLELDAEFARYFYLFRFRVGHDVPLSKDGVQVTSTRVGFDALIKGAEVSFLGSHIVPSYVAFVTHEMMRAEEENNSATLKLPISSFGLGLLLHID